MSNVYYNPEAFALTPVLDVDKSDGCYQFDMFVIWKSDSGMYYWGSDAGCSCPSPFEGKDLSNLRRGDLKTAINDAFAWINEDLSWRGELDQDEKRARKRIEEFRDSQGL